MATKDEMLKRLAEIELCLCSALEDVQSLRGMIMESGKAKKELTPDLKHFLSVIMWEVIRVDAKGKVSAKELQAAIKRVLDENPRLQQIANGCGFIVAPNNFGYRQLLEAIKEMTVVRTSAGYTYYLGISLV